MYLMVGTRVLGYGAEYTVKLIDADTTLEVEHSFDLTRLNNVEIDYDLLKSGKNEFEFTTPNSNNKLKFKILTHGDENNIQKEIDGYKKLAILQVYQMS